MWTKTKKIAVADSYLRLVRQFPLRPIQSNAEYDAAAAVMEKLAVRGEDDLDDGEYDYLDAIIEFVSIYDRRNFPIDLEDIAGVDELKFLIEQSGMKQTELAEILGDGTSAVSMVLFGSRPITADHARTLGKKFSIDPGLFL
jgi:HTH-type transcriptional regulator/antitoxin HigA